MGETCRKCEISFFLKDLYRRYYLKRVGVDEKNIEVDVKKMLYQGTNLIEVTCVQDMKKILWKQQGIFGFYNETNY
jgi:hypothetical protein